MISTIVFDFDETLVQSEQIKQDGFHLVFSPDQKLMEHARQIKALHFSTSRLESFEIILQSMHDAGLLAVDNVEQQAQLYVEQYSKQVDELVSQAKEIPGAQEVLRILQHKGYQLFVNSNTPQKNLRYIIAKRGWDQYFVSVFGSPPKTKQENFDEIIRMSNANQDQVLVVGDGESDLICAQNKGVQFVGLSTAYNTWTQADCSFPVIDTLTDMLQLV